MMMIIVTSSHSFTESKKHRAKYFIYPLCKVGVETIFNNTVLTLTCVTFNYKSLNQMRKTL